MPVQRSFPGLGAWTVTGGVGTPSHRGKEAKKVKSESVVPTRSSVNPLMLCGGGGH